MFDWARGSVLKQMVEAKIPCATYDHWLKGWAAAWPFAVLKFPKNITCLDIGSGNNPYYARIFTDMGCKTHVLEQKYHPRKSAAGWGIRAETIKNHPQITFHIGLAGENKGPANYFDLITCISVMEHIYDSTPVINHKNPFPHLAVLTDMVRMLKPGGILVLTYDFFLNDMPHWRGWDYLTDIAFMEQCGIPLLNPKAELKSRTYIYNYEDTLFMAPEGILSFSKKYLRSTSIGIMFRKPGTKSVIKFSPHPNINNLVLPQSDKQSDDVSAAMIKQMVLSKTQQVIKNYMKKIRLSINR